jgi:hypothetical protein
MATRGQTTWTDPRLPLEILRRAGDLNHRKLRLFAAACCRRVWHLLVEQDSRDAVVIAEQVADQTARKERPKAADLLVAAGAKAEAVATRLKKAKAAAGAVAAAEAARWVVWGQPGDAAFRTADSAARALRGGVRGEAGPEGKAQGGLLVEIHGNPLWPVAPDPRWRTEQVVRLAQAAYDHRLLPGGELEADRLAVLADALEEAGCTDWDVLTHLRRPGPHVRGCWALELLLGKG